VKIVVHGVREPLAAIVYTSQAMIPFDLAAVDALALKSWGANSERDLTGYMNHRDGRFVQYLEGPEAALAETYGRINADERHRIEFSRRLDIRDRRFPAWFMEHLSLSNNDAATTARETALVGAMTADVTDEAALGDALERLIDRVGDMYVAAIL